MSKKNYLPSKIIYKRRLRLYFKFGLYFVFVLVLIGFILWLLNLSRFQISNIQISSIKYVLADDISKFVDNKLSGQVFFINKRSRFLVNRDNLEASIMNAFPNILYIEADYVDSLSSSTIEKTIGKVIGLEIKERIPVAIWCSDGRENCYYIDEASLIFAKSPEFQGDAYAVFRGGDYKIGESIPSKMRINEILKMLSEFDKLGIKSSDIDLDEKIIGINSYLGSQSNQTEKINQTNQLSSANQSNLTNQANQAKNSFLIKIDEKTDLEKAPNRLSLVMNEYKMRNKDFSKKIEYIDMRYGVNIVVKFK